MMNQIQDRRRLRQEYLIKRMAAYGKMVRSAFGTLIGIFVLAWMAPSCFDPDFYNRYSWCVQMFAIAATFVVVVAITSGAARHARIKRDLDAIPYVPRVTTDALEAEEVLVRASEEPQLVQSEVVVRAAVARQTPQAELLRANREAES